MTKNLIDFMHGFLLRAFPRSHTLEFVNGGEDLSIFIRVPNSPVMNVRSVLYKEIETMDFAVTEGHNLAIEMIGE